MTAYQFIDKPTTAASLTMMLDKGLGLNALDDLLELASDYISFAKFGWGTAAVLNPALIKEKNRRYRAHRIPTYPGGTLLEVALMQGKLAEFLAESKQLGFTAIEVSDGSTTVARDQRLAVIAQAKAAGFTVLAEVGKKNPAKDHQLTVADRVTQVKDDLAAGVDHVIIEAREAGKNIGIYDEQGQVLEEVLQPLLALGKDHLIFEAPLKSKQVTLLKQLGPDANFGNVAPADIISLQTLRQGLRGDTVGAFS